MSGVTNHNLRCHEGRRAFMIELFKKHLGSGLQPSQQCLNELFRSGGQGKDVKVWSSEFRKDVTKNIGKLDDLKFSGLSTVEKIGFLIFTGIAMPKNLFLQVSDFVELDEDDHVKSVVHEDLKVSTKYRPNLYSKNTRTKKAEKLRKEEEEKKKMEGITSQKTMNVVTVDPTIAYFSASGGSFSHVIFSQTDSRLAFKVKSSNNENYTVRPVYGFIDAKGKETIEITRKNGPAKEDKIVIQYLQVPAEETNPEIPFRTGLYEGELIVKIICIGANSGQEKVEKDLKNVLKPTKSDSTLGEIADGFKEPLFEPTQDNNTATLVPKAPPRSADEAALKPVVDTEAKTLYSMAKKQISVNKISWISALHEFASKLQMNSALLALIEQKSRSCRKFELMKTDNLYAYLDLIFISVRQEISSSNPVSLSPSSLQTSPLIYNFHVLCDAIGVPRYALNDPYAIAETQLIEGVTKAIVDKFF